MEIYIYIKDWQEYSKLYSEWLSLRIKANQKDKLHLTGFKLKSSKLYFLVSVVIILSYCSISISLLIKSTHNLLQWF